MRLHATFTGFKSLRFWSLLLCAASVLPIAYFGYQNWLFSQWAKQRISAGGYVCGTGMLALFALCAVVTWITAGVGSLLGVVGYLRHAAPRPRKRYREIVAVLMYTAAAFVTSVAMLFL